MRLKMKKIKNIILSCLLCVGCVLSLTGCTEKAPAGNVAEEITLADGDKTADIVIEDYGTISVKLFPDLAPNAVENFIKLAESGYYDGLKIHYVAKDECIRGGSLNGDGTGGTALVSDEGQFGVETDPNARNFYGAVGYVADQYGYNTATFYMVNNKKTDDITKYSADLIKTKATNYADQKESLEEGDPLLEYLNYEEAYYTNLADMIGKASEDVVKKYAEKGGNPLWDGGYTVFGQIYSGFDVLDKLSSVDVVMGREGNKTKPKTDIIIESVTISEYITPEETE